MSNNDADAFRHAYVSGVFTQEKGEMRANLAGIYNEMKGTNPINQQNMDLWNNSVGRKHGKKSKTREELADFIEKSLENNDYLYTEEGKKRIDDNGLVAFCLLIAHSKPEEKETFVKLIVNLINKRNG